MHKLDSKKRGAKGKMKATDMKSYTCLRSNYTVGTISNSPIQAPQPREISIIESLLSRSQDNNDRLEAAFTKLKAINDRLLGSNPDKTSSEAITPGSGSTLEALEKSIVSTGTLADFIHDQLRRLEAI